MGDPDLHGEISAAVRRCQAATSPMPPGVDAPPETGSAGDRRGLDTYRFAVWAVVLLGVALRLHQYVYNRSLWLDEAFLALNLLEKPFTALFGQLSFNQAAPPGFLLVERVDVAMFGKSEYALRLFPLVCGIGSLFLFERLTRLVLGRAAALLALALFSVSEGLVYYSSEVKQYSTDVAAGLVVTLAALDLRRRSPTRRRLASWALLGPIAVWFSYAAAFVVAAAVVVLLAEEISRRGFRLSRRVLAVPAAWIVSLVAALVYARAEVSHLLSTYQVEGATKDAVFPTGLKFFRNGAGGLVDAIGIPTTGPGHVVRYAIGAIAVVGAVVLARRARVAFGLLAVPAAAVVVGAALHAYPVLPRTVLFLLPLVIVLTSEGAVALASRVPGHRALAVGVVALAVCAPPAESAAEHVLHPRQREETRPVLAHLAHARRPGDALFVFYRAQYALAYYLECDCLGALRGGPGRWGLALAGDPGPAQYAPVLASRTDRVVVAPAEETLRGYLQIIEPFRGRRRVWLVATALDTTERSLLDYLACVGRRREAFLRDDGEGPFRSAAAYGFDLSGWRSLAGGACGARFGLR